MSRLSQVLSEKENAEKHKGMTEKKQNTEIPTYDLSGKTLNPEKEKKQRKMKNAVFTITFLLIFIYIPGMIMNLFDLKKPSTGYTVPVDSGSLKRNSDIFLQSPDEDFDSDGITNDREQNIEMSNPYNSDSDGDGASDYYELYVSKTAPNQYDENLVIDEQKQQDEKDGKSVGTPYRMGNVILWADDYRSKAMGGVIENLAGYNFSEFNGYAQFPDDTEIYAYGVCDNVRTLLPYREAENAWRINGINRVEIYQEPLTDIVEFNIFFHPFYGNANWFTKKLAAILPDRGFICATQKTTMDIEPDTSRETLAPIIKPDFDIEDPSRLTKNTDSLSNLQYVRSMIEEGRCVAVSLYNQNEGEYIGIVYGYTHWGNLLIADLDTLEPVGEIEITEVGQKMLDDENSFVLHSYFVWNGFGFTSSHYDRISFFAVSDQNGTFFAPDMELNETINIEETTAQPSEEITKTSTERPAEITTEDVTEEIPTEETTEAATETATENLTEETTSEEATQPPAQPQKTYRPPSNKNTNNHTTETPKLDSPTIK